MVKNKKDTGDKKKRVDEFFKDVLIYFVVIMVADKYSQYCKNGESHTVSIHRKGV